MKGQAHEQRRKRKRAHRQRAREGVPVPSEVQARESAEALGYYNAEDFEPEDLNETNDWEFAP